LNKNLLSAGLPSPVKPESAISDLISRLEECPGAERRRLRRRIEGLRRKPTPRALERVREAVDEAATRRKARADAIKRVTYPDSLPVSDRREEIKAAIDAHRVVVVCGETGSGKTTQLPKMCLELGRGIDGLIGHTQPRRVAARTVAARIAEELGTPLGSGVGYKIRFGDQTTPATRVKLMTDGILLAETQGDPGLEAYDTVIVDEAHERSLNIDFLLGYLRNLLPKRPDLKIIITSATIDPERFAKHFEEALHEPVPIINVAGRTYPVEVRYRPLDDPERSIHDRSQPEAILDAAAEIERTGPGDVLIFMPGEREIRETAETLRKHHQPTHPATQILPLYGRLSIQEQNRAFQATPNVRRFVIATNVAETSVTVPGIRFVIDPGAARISRYSTRTKVQRLEVEPISRASADQRKGRCGRIGPGVCLRLYSEEDFGARDEYTPPEILRTSLASVILRMESLRLGAVEDFPFLEPPEPRNIRDGYETLRELDAIGDDHKLTKTGHALARFPVDPRISRMLLAGSEHGSLREVLVLASALSVQDPRDRPFNKRREADTAHLRFQDETSDFLSLLKLWDHYHEQKERLSSSKLRRACQQQFISWVRMREWIDVHRQLRELSRELKLRINTQPADAGSIHKALLTGLLSSVGRRTEDGDYEGPRGVRFYIFPGSDLARKKPDWIVASELVRTSRLFARKVAKIEPEWIEDAAERLIKTTHAEPKYLREKEHVSVTEKVTLFGLELVKSRRVPLGSVDPETARELFIHHALVLDELSRPRMFAKKNREVLAKVKDLEAKTRRPDFLADERARFAFFDERLPADVWSGDLLDKWLKTQPDEALVMTEADALAKDPAGVTREAYPDRLEGFGEKLKIRYELKPGEKDDGVTVTLPLEALARFDTNRGAWLVPGLLAQKVEALLAQVPKRLRRALGSPADTAKDFAASVTFASGPLDRELADYLSRRLGEPVDPALFDDETADDYLRMRYRVIDANGREIGIGRDLAELRKRLRDHLRGVLAEVEGEGFNIDGLTGWDIDELPEKIETRQQGRNVVGFPALIDKGQTVSVRLLETMAAAEEASRLGLRRLFALQARRELEYQIEHLPGFERAALALSPLVSPIELRAQLRDLTAERAFVADRPLVRTARAFEARLDEGWGDLTAHALASLRLAEAIAQEHHQLSALLERKHPDAWTLAVGDIRSQVAAMLGPRFLVETPAEWLGHLPRYLRAARMRLDKLRGGGVDRDTQGMRQLAAHWRRFAELSAAQAERGIRDPALTRLRWMLEEFRVSLFAQELGTAASVSDKKLTRQAESCMRTA